MLEVLPVVDPWIVFHDSCAASQCGQQQLGSTFSPSKLYSPLGTSHPHRLRDPQHVFFLLEAPDFTLVWSLIRWNQINCDFEKNVEWVLQNCYRNIHISQPFVMFLWEKTVFNVKNRIYFYYFKIKLWLNRWNWSYLEKKLVVEPFFLKPVCFFS